MCKNKILIQVQCKRNFRAKSTNNVQNQLSAKKRIKCKTCNMQTNLKSSQELKQYERTPKSGKVFGALKAILSAYEQVTCKRKVLRMQYKVQEYTCNIYLYIVTCI